MIIYNKLIIIIIFTIIIQFTECMKYEKEFQFSSNYYTVEQFGFDNNGIAFIDIQSLQIDGITYTGNKTTLPPTPTATITIAPPTTSTPVTSSGIQPIGNISLWICQDRDYQSIIGSSPTNTIETKLCQGTATVTNCPVSNIQIINGYTGTFDIKDSDMYKVIILKCSDYQTASIKMNYILVNPTGQLEKGLLQLPLLYRYILIIFCFLFFLVTIYWYKNKRSLNILHFILYIVLILKIILIIVLFSYWTNANNDGKFSLSLWYVQNLFYAFSETSFFGVLFILSRGLKVTRSTLNRSELKAISVVLLFLCGILMFFRFYNDIYYFLSLMILYFFMMPKIFTNITKNLRLLFSHSILSRYINNIEQVNNLAEKKRVFTNLRTAVVLYLGFILFVNSLRIVMVWHLYWVAFTLAEPIFILMISFLCWSFRPNSSSSTSIFRNPNLNAVDFLEITRNIESLLNPNIDPVLLSTILEIRSFDPNTCHLIKYPNSTSYSLAVEIVDSNNNYNNEKIK